MKMMRRYSFVAVVAAVSALGSAQIPDVLSALDAGGRAMGMGGAGNITGADTLSGYNNPAGLGYVDRTQVGVVLRNLPESKTAVTGPFAPLSQQQFSTTGSGGPLALTHAGVAMPLKDRSGRSKGTVSLGITLGGFLHDVRTSNNLSSGALTVRNYSELTKIRTDVVTLSFGKTNEAQNFNWGVGVMYATTGILDRRRGQLFDGSNNVVGDVDSDVDETGTGFGVVAGVQYVPRNQPNSIFGLSFHSEINLSGNSNSQDLYDKVPARISAGFATRRDGLRGGRDYLVLGAEVEHLFSGGPSPFGGTRDAQTRFGAGLEYTYNAQFGRVPIRVGYSWNPSAGDHFDDRSGLVYGIGYRPNGSDLSLDLNWGDPDTGGRDFSFGVSYKVKR
ncbi:MAG: hypothetical protein M9921_00395 [Fimbriimonadaceae bacterium]|nr:hypothetical protein [Chthonomonadaceae bacterium]MCO5295294.1 hypothetical protein [Fimbriimonadaceae bacterium]